MFKYFILIAVLVAGGRAYLRKEDVADGGCAVVKPQDGDISFFASSKKGEKWYITMASEYGQRYNIEILLGHPAHSEDELQFHDPLVFLTDEENPIIMGLTVKDIAIRGTCTAKSSSSSDYACDVHRGVLNGKNIQDPSIKWVKLGSPTANIFKGDPDAKYVLVSVCSQAQKTRYWIAVSQATPLPENIQKKIRGEVKATGVYNKDKIFVLN